MICSISGFTTIFPQPRFGRGRMNIPRGESYQHSLGSSAWEGHHVWGKWCATQLCKKCQDKRGMLPFPLEFGIGAMAGTGHFYLSLGVCSLLCESDCVEYVWIVFPSFHRPHDSGPIQWARGSSRLAVRPRLWVGSTNIEWESLIESLRLGWSLYIIMCTVREVPRGLTTNVGRTSDEKSAINSFSETRADTDTQWSPTIMCQNWRCFDDPKYVF